MRLVAAIATVLATVIGCHVGAPISAPTGAAPLGSGLELELDERAFTFTPDAAPAPEPVEVARVIVTHDREIGYPSEVVGVLDFHSQASSEDKGFAELRARAAALGADAVIGAEFEHGEDGGLSHLSGMAVRAR